MKLNYDSVIGSWGVIPWMIIWAKITFMLVREDAYPHTLINDPAFSAQVTVWDHGRKF
jgi:hypothetical protein